MYEDHPLVQLAIRQLGSLEEATADLPRFFEVLGDTIEAVGEFTGQLGLSVGQVVDLISTVRLHETPAEFRGNGHHRHIISVEARRAVTLLYIRGLDAPAIALLLGLEAEYVEDYLASRGAVGEEREVFALHREGYTPHHISQRLPVSRSTVQEIIKRAGEQPHTTQECGLSELRARIVAMRQEGASYGEIRAATGARENQVRNAIRYGMAKGLLPRTCERERASA